MSDLVNKLNDDFKSILNGIEPSRLAEEMKEYEARLREHRALAGGKTLPTFIKPYFIPAGRIPYYRKAVETVLKCQEKLIDLYSTSPEHRPYFELEDAEVPLVEIPSRLPRHIYFSRLDAITPDAGPGEGDGGFKFLEFNCDSPGGAYYADIHNELTRDLSVMKELYRRYRFVEEQYRPRVLDSLLSAWKGAGKTGKPRIAVMGNPEVTNVEEFRLFADYFREKGFESIFTDPWTLEYDGSELRKDGQGIDLIYRRGVLKDYAAHPDEAKPVVDAYRDGNVIFANPLCAKLGDNKSLLSLMSDSRSARLFTDEERFIIDRHITWTSVLRDGPAVYRGEEVDLLEMLRSRRENFVLKPNSEFGGKGVIIGRDAAVSEWDAALDAWEAKNMVVQEYVPIPEAEFPVFSPDLEFETKKYNVNFFTFAGEYGGGFVRTSNSRIINISAGGALVTFYLVKDE